MLSILWYLLIKAQFTLCRIDDILADSDSDLPEDMETEDGVATTKPGMSKSKSKSKQPRSTYIREDVDEIVDLADLKSIGNVLSKLHY